MTIFYDIDLPDDEGGGGGGSNVPAAKPATGGGPLVTTKPSPGAPNNPNAPVVPARIPLPNYSDTKSRGTYAENFYKQYPGVGHGRGDTPLRVNEIPGTASDTLTAKQMSINAAKKLGIDPALLYASAMEEGMSGLFPDKNNQVDAAEDPKFPVDGYASFGLDTFADKFQGLVKKGYLPAEFANNFKKNVRTNELKQTVNSADFKDVASALQAKAAIMKGTYDDIDGYAKQRGITLSPKARDFFSLADYNGGEGVGHQMLNDYYNNGHLEGDKFLQGRPTTGKGLKDSSYKGVYDNVMRRMVMRDALKEQTLFDN